MNIFKNEQLKQDIKFRLFFSKILRLKNIINWIFFFAFKKYRISNNNWVFYLVDHLFRYL